RVLWFTGALSLLTGFVFGLAPAWQSARADLSEVLKEGGRATAGGGVGKLRGGLVVTEVALALVLLVGAGLLTRSLARLLDADPGFNPENVLTMTLTLPHQRYGSKEQVNGFHRRLLERVAALPGVQSASASNSLPGRTTWQTDIAVEGHQPVNPGEEINVDWTIVSEDFFRVMEVPLRRGRAFTAQEVRDGAPVVLVDERLAERFWPGGDALGKRIKYDSPTPHEIVGVVPSIREYGSETPGRIHIYTPLGRQNLRTVTLSVRAAAPDFRGLAAAVAGEARAVDRDMPVYDVETLEQVVGRAVSPRKFNLALLGLFAAVALVLAAVGIYGVVSFSVAQRTHELGVRIALGAEARDVLRLVVGRGMRLVLVGVGLGLLGSLALTRLMSGLLYGVGAHDPFTFAAVALLLVGVSLLACYLPARRATRVDPVIALRHE
nr:ABC transporter permease [Acidobacteriota bacterium]